MTTICVCGAGTMGSGITQNMLNFKLLFNFVKNAQ